MPIESADPDLEARLRLDAHAPRAARYHVAQVDRPSPDLRDAVVLLTSELVTRAVQQCESPTEVVELRVWMPSDVVRVELRAPRELLRLPLEEPRGPDYDVMLLGQVADRWAIDTDEEPACMWFEIDRQAPRPDPTPVAHPTPMANPKSDLVASAATARRRRLLVRRSRGHDKAR